MWTRDVIQVYIQSGETKGPLKDAVVVAKPLAGVSHKGESAPTAVIDQINKEFVPYISVVTAGTAIQLPNSDDIRHHVYSFSPAKTFELPLYTGFPANPVIFDKEGIVTLGCNIHDWMRAYIYVVVSPYYSISNKDGRAVITELPTGEYEVYALHYDMISEKTPETIRVSLKEDQKTELQFLLELKPGFRPRRSPMRLNRGRY